VTPSILTSQSGIPVYVFDLTKEPHGLRDGQWSSTAERSPSDAKGICLHQLGEAPKVPYGDKVKFGLPGAVARQGLQRPAHISVSMAKDVPVVSICHPLTRYTFHGDLANGSYIGVEVRVKFPFEETHRTAIHAAPSQELAAGIEVALSVALQLLQAWAGNKPYELLTHRQSIGQGGPEKCCSEGVLALALEGLPKGFMVDPDHVLGETGFPWPESWRDHLTHSAEAPKQEKPISFEEGDDPEDDDGA